MRGHLTLWPQGCCITELENWASIFPPEELEHIKDDNDILDYEPEGLDPSEESEAQEEIEVSKAEWANMDLPELGHITTAIL